MSNQIKFFRTAFGNLMNYIYKTIRLSSAVSDLVKIELFLVVCLINCLFFGIEINGQKQTAFDEISLNTGDIDLSQPLKVCQIYQSKQIKYAVAASDNKPPNNNKSTNKFTNSSIIYLVLEERKIIAFDVKKNQLIWSTELGGTIVSELIVDNGKINVITALENIKKTNSEIDSEAANKYRVYYKMWSLDENTGITVRQTDFNLKTFGSFRISSFPDFFLISDTGENLIKINKNLVNKDDKDDKDDFETSDSYFRSPANLNSLPAFLNGKIYVAAGNDSILVLSTQKSDFFSKLQTLPYAATILNSYKNFLLFGDRNGWLTLYDSIRNKIIWRRRYGGEISSVTITENSILITSLDNFVYLLTLNKGKTLWKKRLSGRVIIKPLIPENFLSIITDSNNNIYVLNLNNGKVVNQISMPENAAVLQSPFKLGKILLFLTNEGLYEAVNQDEICPQSSDS